jgi:hypothetical protein
MHPPPYLKIKTESKSGRAEEKISIHPLKIC